MNIHSFIVLFIISILSLTYVGGMSAAVRPDATILSDSIAADSVCVEDIPTIELEGVTVTEALKSRDAVRETITVTNAMREGTNSAIALLGNVPGITLDRISEEIRVGMESGVPILVDGREVSPEYAKSINPSRLGKVEIIRQPQGRYAEYPVVVNLVLKPSFRGWDIGIQAKGMLNLNHRNSNSENGSLNLTFSSEKWNAYANLGYMHKNVYEASAFEREIAGVSLSAVKTDPGNPNQHSMNDNGTLFAGVDYKASRSHRISLQALGSLAASRQSEFYRYTGITPDEKISDKYRTQEYAAGLFYDGTFGDRFTLNVETFYDFYKNRDTYLYEEHPRQDVPDGISGTVGAPAYVSLTPSLGEKHYALVSAEGTYSILPALGIKVSDMLTYRRYTTLDDDSGVWTYRSTEYRNRGDVNIFWNPGQRFSLNGGCTLLTVNSDYTSYLQADAAHKTTTTPLPYARASWRIGGGFSLYANYYYTITYPVLDYLSPVRYEIGNGLYRRGNPSLRSSAMHYVNAELDFKGMLKVTFMQRFSRRDITDYYMVEDNLVVRTYANSDFSHAYIGLEGNFDLTHGFNISATGAYQWYSRKSDMTARHRGHSWLLDTQFSYMADKLGLLAFAQYFLRYDRLPLLQGEEYNQQETLAVGVNKVFLDGKVSLGLIGSIPVSAISKMRWTKIDIPGFRDITYRDDRVNRSMLILNLRISLGNSKSSSRKRALELEAEKQL